MGVSAEAPSPAAAKGPTSKAERSEAALPRWAVILSWLLFAVIGLLFAAQLAALVTHRLDYPINDDWRYYMQDETDRYAMPAELTTAWLFAPAQDTLHVTGKALDWMLFNWFAHDWHVLAVLSFVLGVGGWLWFGTRLVLGAAGDNAAARVGGLALFIVPLAGNPYWVALSPFQWLEPAIAYHQMLPVFGLMAIASALLRPASQISFPTLREAAVAMLTIVFGLSYSSGAVSLAAFSTTVFVLSIRRSSGSAEDPIRELRSEAGLVLTCSLLCLALHVLVPMAVLEFNPIASTRNFQASLPWTPEFWRFLLGMFDRAVHATAIGSFSLARGALVLAAFVVPVAALAWAVVTRKLEGTNGRSAILLVGCLVTVGSFALLVAYGRAGFGGTYVPWYPEVGPELYARNRFFFWWLSAMVPLVGVAWALVVAQAGSQRAALVTVAVLCALALAPKPQHPESRNSYLDYWNYPKLYAYDASVLSRMIEIDREHTLVGRRPDLDREGLTREDEFRERRWIRRVGRSALVLGRNATRQKAGFVERWELDYH